MKAKRRYVNQATTPPITVGSFTVTATYTGAPVNPTLRLSDFPCGHDFGVSLMDDDGGIVAKSYAELVSEYRYSDNAGGTRPVGLGLALNGRGTVAHDGSNPEYISFSQLKALFAAYPHVAGLNHSADHSNDDSDPATPPTVATATEQLRLNAQIFWTQIQYRLGGTIIPGGQPYFVQASMNLSLSGISSSGYDHGPNYPMADGYQDRVHYVDGFALSKYVPGQLMITTRFNADNLFVHGVEQLKAETLQRLNNAKNANDKRVFALFSHTPNDAPTLAAIREYIQWVLTLNEGRVWMGNMQELWDYYTTKQKATISPLSVSDNTVTFQVTGLPADARYWDMSFFLGGGTLQSVQVSGASGNTFNPATGLLNVQQLNPAVAVPTPPVTITPLAKPVAAVAGTMDNAAAITWAAVAGNSGFRIRRADNTGMSLNVETVTAASTALSAILTGLASEHTYYVQVQAIGTGQYSDSPWSDVVIATTTAPSAPGVDNDPDFAQWDAQPKTTGKVPYPSRYIFWSNNYHDIDFAAWTDGSLAPYYGGQYKYQDPYSNANSRVVVTTRRYRTDLTHIRVVYRQASPNPIVVKYIPKGGFNEVLLGEIPNQLGPTWIQLDFPQKTAVSSLVFYSKNGSDQVSELELYGDYVMPVVPVPVVVNTPMREHVTTNFFQWDFLQSDDPANVQESKINQMRQYNAGRWYGDAVHVNPVEGRYMVDPTSNDYGSWNWGNLAKRLKAENMDFRLCIKNQSPHLINTYPEEYRTTEQKACKWQGSIEATVAFAKTAEAYRERGELWFQMGARGGTVAVPWELINIYQTVGDVFPGNKKARAEGWLKRGEGANELESWWRGFFGSMTPMEIERYHSAMYDGDMGRMGPGVGVKNADPSINFSLGGLAIWTIETLHGIIESARIHRGYNPDGTVNVPFDCINGHIYANDGGSLQIGNITRGMCPEKAGLVERIQTFLDFCAEWLGNMPVIVGEWGYDVSEFSSQSAVRPIDLVRDSEGNVVKDQYGNRLVKQGPDRTQRYKTQRDWSIRTMEIFAAKGIAESNNYMDKDASTPASEHSRYSACGMTNFDGTRRPSGNACYQVLHLTGPYVVTATDWTEQRYISTKTDPATGKQCQVLWVPDEIDRKEQHTFTLTAPAVLHHLQDEGTETLQTPLGVGTHTIELTETPCYLMLAA